MYLSFFGLKRRPFGAAPDPECRISMDGLHQAFTTLMQCAVEGRGIGVLTAPPGLGKTLVCQCLAREVSRDFSVVLFPSSNFLTRRSLLQAVLYELGHSYVRMPDQELRLALISTLRQVRPSRRGVVLIADEAHLLAARMLEELRTLTNLVDEGEPLVRLIVSGHLALEEILSLPALDAFNQRIGAHVNLEPLMRKEAAEYIVRRLTWAGANAPDVLNAEAIDLIGESSDGSPRCINQLADHSLTLGYLASEKPVAVHTVRHALEDLKRLPLSWNESISRRQTTDEPSNERMNTVNVLRQPVGTVETLREEASAARISTARIPVEIAETVRESESEDEIFAIEFGASDAADLPLTRLPAATASQIVAISREPQTSSVKIKCRPADHTDSRPVALTRNDRDVARQEVDEEEIVIDRYAALDAAISRLTRTVLASRTLVHRHEPVRTAPGTSSMAISKTAAIAKTASEAATAAGPAMKKPMTDAASDYVPPLFDIVLPEEPPVSDAPVRGHEDRRDLERNMGTATNPRRPYDRLFSDLRRRRVRS